jgi:hypothetical protein
LPFRNLLHLTYCARRVGTLSSGAFVSGHQRITRAATAAGVFL